MSSVLSDPGKFRLQSAFWPLGSIRARLALLYVLSAVAMFTLAAVALQWALTSSLQDEDARFLTQKVQTLRLVFLESPQDVAALRQEVNGGGSGSAFSPDYARVQDQDGLTLAETTGMSARVPAVFPQAMPFDGKTLAAREWQAPDGRNYLLAACWVGLGSDRHVFQVALDVSHDGAVIASFRRKMAAIFLVGVLASATVGAWVARQGLHPLAQITAAAQEITPSRLDGRIGPSGWPKELGALAAAFDAMLERLEESFTRLSQFSADIAHELRTPVSNLAGAAEVALSRSRTPAEYQRLIESSLEEYGRLSQIVEGLLFLARAETASFLVSREYLNGRVEAEAVCEYFEALSDEQEVRLDCEGEGLGLADRMLLRRAISNLVANAIQNTLPGGQVTVIVRALPGDSLDGSGAEVLVKDTGVGIAAADLKHLFDRFYQCDPARSHDGRGSGLGLSIVQSIMHAHGGSVHIHSTAGDGTRVTLRFPG